MPPKWHNFPYQFCSISSDHVLSSNKPQPPPHPHPSKPHPPTDRAEFPDLQRLVVGGGDEQAAVDGPGHVRNTQLVAGDGLLELAVIRTPHLDQLVCR